MWSEWQRHQGVMSLTRGCLHRVVAKELWSQASLLWSLEEQDV